MFGIFKKKDWHATVNSDKEVLVKAGDNLLAAGLAAGLDWPHDCRVGSCGTCRCRLKSGKIKPLKDFSYVLTPDELSEGSILACQTQLKSDVEIEVELGAGDKANITELKGVLSSTRRLTHDILEIRITCDRPLPEKTLAGQYMSVAYPGLSKPRSYSLAEAPRAGQKEMSFYIRHVPGGEFTDWLFSEDRLQTLLTVEGPYGNFGLHETDAPMLCIAGGSGMSAIKSVLDYACQTKAPRDALYLFGAREEKDLYCLPEMEQIKKNWNQDYQFKFIPVLSGEPEDSAWVGARGYVTTYLKETYLPSNELDIKQCEAYMCGPPPMIDAGIQLLTEEGLSVDNIFYDKFLDASSMPGGR